VKLEKWMLRRTHDLLLFTCTMVIVTESVWWGVGCHSGVVRS